VCILCCSVADATVCSRRHAERCLCSERGFLPTARTAHLTSLRAADDKQESDKDDPKAAIARIAGNDPSVEKVDIMTYFFGKPGELDRDLARLGESPFVPAFFRKHAARK